MFFQDVFIVFRVAREDAQSSLYVTDEGNGSGDTSLVGAVRLVKGNLVIIACLGDAHQRDKNSVGLLYLRAFYRFFDGCSRGMVRQIHVDGFFFQYRIILIALSGLHTENIVVLPRVPGCRECN